MIDLVYMILSLLSILNIKIKGLNTFFEDYMDLNNTNAIKGIFVWMIFIRHFIEYCKEKANISIIIYFYFFL